jgi:tetratricopeptide (TPR) repeat protein
VTHFKARLTMNLRTLAACAVTFLSTSVLAAPPGMDEAIADLTHRWAQATYQTAESKQGEAYLAVITASEQATRAYPGQAEPLVWQAIALSSAAKVEGGLGALAKVKQARDLLLAAEKIDPKALSGSIYGSLGSLYAKVPGWPIGFGDKAKAKEYLLRALAINPTGIDPNYFYADFLIDQGQYALAAQHLDRALAAPPRAGREDSDAGRRRDVQVLYDRLRKDHGTALVSR